MYIKYIYIGRYRGKKPRWYQVFEVHTVEKWASDRKSNFGYTTLSFTNADDPKL